MKLTTVIAETLNKSPRKGTVAWEREQQRKKKERDPEEIKRIEQIGKSNHQVGNAKVTHEGKGYTIDRADQDEFTPDEIARIKDSHFPDTLRDNLRTKKATQAKQDRFNKLRGSSEGGESSLGSPAAHDSTGVTETYTGHFNDDDWYEVDPKTKTVICHAGGHSAYRSPMIGQPIQLPNGNILVKGMRAKYMAPVQEHIIKHGSGYRLVSKKSGKNLGDFPTKAAAEKHEREVEYFKHQNESADASRFDPNLVSILQQRGFSGPVPVSQLGRGWATKLRNVVEPGDVVMSDGSSPSYSAWVAFSSKLGKYAYGQEGGFTTGPAARMEKLTRTKVHEGEEQKWKVSYDVYGSNREVPLYTNTRTVTAASADEAIATLKGLVGGRNHRAVLASAAA